MEEASIRGHLWVIQAMIRVLPTAHILPCQTITTLKTAIHRTIEALQCPEATDLRHAGAVETGLRHLEDAVVGHQEDPEEVGKTEGEVALAAVVDPEVVGFEVEAQCFCERVKGKGNDKRIIFASQCIHQAT